MRIQLLLAIMLRYTLRVLSLRYIVVILTFRSIISLFGVILWVLVLSGADLAAVISSNAELSTTCAKFKIYCGPMDAIFTFYEHYTAPLCLSYVSLVV